MKLAGLGVVLVAGALWLSPPQPLVALFASGGEGGTPQPRPAQAPAAAPADASAAINPLAGLAPGDFAEIAARPLFNPSRAGAAPPPPPPQPQPVAQETPADAAPAESASDFSLLGVAGSLDQPVALVRWNKNNQVYHLKQGQYLSDWKLAEVGGRQASLEKDGTVLTLRLFAAAGGADAALDAGGSDPGSDGDTTDSGDSGDTSDSTDSGTQ